MFYLDLNIFMKDLQIYKFTRWLLPLSEAQTPVAMALHGSRALNQQNHVHYDTMYTTCN